jgi:hypothetical protein
VQTRTSLALPILDKIKDKTLVLSEITFSPAQASSLAQALLLLPSSEANRFTFANNGLHPCATAQML